MNESLSGQAAPPMENGELVFAAPWQGRIFGMAKTLADRGVFEWDDFREELIRRIAESERETCFDYYSCFQSALENILANKNLVSSDSLEESIITLAARPHDHG